MALLLVALLTLPTVLAAAGLPALRQGGGARAAALASAGTALFAAQALNPAARQSRGRSVAFNHQASIQHIRQNHLHLTQARGRGTWGLAAQLWQADDLERRTGPSAEPLGHFGVYEGTVGLSYARQMERTRLGLQLKFIRQSIFTQNASGLAADLGLMCNVSASLRLGATVRNLGRMNHLDQQETDLPLEARLGAAYVGAQTCSWPSKRKRPGATTSRCIWAANTEPASTCACAQATKRPKTAASLPGWASWSSTGLSTTPMCLLARVWATRTGLASS